MLPTELLGMLDARHMLSSARRKTNVMSKIKWKDKAKYLTGGQLMGTIAIRAKDLGIPVYNALYSW